MKHKHYEMIVAKAENMDLVVLIDTAEDGWIDSDLTEITYLDNNFFLCLPQHKEACSHWLNGGAIQDYHNGEWTKIKGYDGSPDWNEPDQLFMNEEFHLRIAPKKEKRWIGVHPDGHCGGTHFDGYAKAESDSPMGYQIIEIEVEV